MHSWFTEGVATADLQDVNACSMNVLVDPRPALTDVQAKYGSQLSEIYGSDRTTRTVRLLTDTRWPIPVAALVIALGWFLTLLPVDASLVIDKPDGLLALFKPQRRFSLSASSGRTSCQHYLSNHFAGDHHWRVLHVNGKNPALRIKAVIDSIRLVGLCGSAASPDRAPQGIGWPLRRLAERIVG